MNIKHIVISGGGPSFLQALSSIQYLNEKNIINFDKIKTIYGTSAGALLAAILCMKFDWETVNDYIIKRPWIDVFNIKAQHIFEAYNKRGLLDKSIIEKAFKPLLCAKDISMNITLKEFYEYSKIELHVFAFEINNFDTEDISYLTHPELSLLDALLMSSSIPILMTPTIIENKCYIDGGLCANYPLLYCIQTNKNLDEILGIRNQYDEDQENKVDSTSTLLDFILCILFKIFNKFTNHPIPEIKYEVKCKVKKLNLNYLTSFLKSIELRQQYYHEGIHAAKLFIDTHNLQDCI